MSTEAPFVARVTGVGLHYRKTTALAGINLNLPAGRMIGFIGPDGVGKSSLLALIAGARRIQSGQVEVLGGDMADRRERARVCPRIAYMPQGLGRNLYPNLSVYENIEFFARLFGLARSERRVRIGNLLRATGIAAFPDRPAGKLSGGMRQKLGLCCALVHDPDLLILDEPTTGVDPLSRRQFWELIGHIRGRRPGMSVLVATAYYSEAEGFELLIAMNGGRLVASGTPSELKSAVGESTLEGAFAKLIAGTSNAAAARFVMPARQGDGAEVAIEARNLTCRFGNFVAVDNVSFRIARGEIFGFLGPNGCGKTTTMKMLTGLLAPTSGQAWMFGNPVHARDIAMRRRVGFMSQSFSLYTELTVLQNLQLHAQLFHLPRRDIGPRIATLVRQFGLADYQDEVAEHLPLGVRQRLSLAVAVIHRPELLILDEPTSGVDPLARDHFWRLLAELSREHGATVFISTHFMNEAERCDRVSLMYEGRVLTQDPPQEIVRKSGTATLEDAFIAHLQKVMPEQATVGSATEAAVAKGTGASRSGFTARRLWAYARRETMEIRRDPIRLSFALLGPILLMIVFGFGITFDVERLSYAVLDRDRTPDSRAYLEAFSSSRYFNPHAELRDPHDLDRRMQNGELRFAIEVPPGFGRDLHSGRSPEIAVWVDGAFPFRAETTRAYVEGAHAQFLQSAVLRMSGHAPLPAANIEARYRYNQEFSSVFAVVPGSMMMLLMFVPAIMTALAVVREREMGSIVNFYVTPTTKLEFLLGKQLPYVGIGLVNFATLVALAVFLFGVPIKASAAALVLGAVIYVIASTGFGLLVSNFVKTQIAAIIAAGILSTVPAIQYSGYLLPVSSLSRDAQLIGRAFSSTWYLHISLGTFTKGLQFASFATDFAALGIIVVVTLALAHLALREQES
jgi:ribosome-dependent ATPase